MAEDDTKYQGGYEDLIIRFCVNICDNVQWRPLRPDTKRARTKPSALNAVDSKVKRNKPLAIKKTIATSEKFHCSKPNAIANIRMKMTLVDFVIVYSDTVMYIKLQLEQPISKAQAIAVGKTLFK